MPLKFSIFLISTLLLSEFCHAYDFILHEQIGRNWTREFVTFPLNKSQLKKVKKQAVLVRSNGEHVPWQLVKDPNDEPRIGFQVNLGKYSTRKWEFSSDETQTQVKSDLKIDETNDVIRISNFLTGVAISKHPMGDAGPVSGIMLNSGKWIGSSQLISDTKISSWKVDITESGPVMIEIRCVVEFGSKGIWESHYRLYANEPVVLVDEKFSVDTKVSFELGLSKNFNPTELFYRYGKSNPKGRPAGRVGTNATWSLTQGNVFTMEPWLRWWMNDRQGSTFSLYNKKDNDLLTLAAREAGSWVDPDIPEEKRTPPLIDISMNESGLHANFSLGHGERKWMVGAFNRDKSLSILNKPGEELSSPIPYQYLVKYGHFPLNQVKDYILSWPGTVEHPHLLVTKKDVVKFNDRETDQLYYEKKVQYFLKTPTLLNEFSLDTAIPAFLSTGSPGLGRLLAEYTIKSLQHSVDYLIDQKGLPFGAAPHHQRFLATSVNVADILMDSEYIDPITRKRIRSKVAFLAYTTSRPDYWSPVRGYAANPNMSTIVTSNRTRLAAFISDHPLAADWMNDGLLDLREKLDNWSDANGGWLEAPHYAMLSYDNILSLLVIAYNAGINDWLYAEPKVKKVIQWLAKIASPPDTRIGGYRHHPAIGNTYFNEPTGEYGLLAYLFAEKDPDFSAEMQWQFNQSNRYNKPGIGGAFPAFSGYREILTDPNLPERSLQYKSELFPETGLVLRDSYPSNRETYMHMILGKNHAHYDYDSGSIIIYGKGRIISDDFGYYGRAPQEDHNMLEFKDGGHGIMQIQDLKLSPRFDYVAGVKGPWMRQVIMAKGVTENDPTYFVINDTLDSKQKANWRLWLTAKEVYVNQNQILVIGKEDVDTDIYILSPDTPIPNIEKKTRKSSSGMYQDWHWEPMTTTQYGLTLPENVDAGVRVIIFPRLKISKSPIFKSLAEGRGVKIIHGSGTDYVFLSKTPFTYIDAAVKFEGSTGMVQFRHGEVSLSLGDEGSIRAGEKYLTSGGANDVSQ